MNVFRDVPWKVCQGWWDWCWQGVKPFTSTSHRAESSTSHPDSTQGQERYFGGVNEKEGTDDFWIMVSFIILISISFREEQNEATFQKETRCWCTAEGIPYCFRSVVIVKGYINPSLYVELGQWRRWDGWKMIPRWSCLESTRKWRTMVTEVQCPEQWPGSRRWPGYTVLVCRGHMLTQGCSPSFSVISNHLDNCV